MTEWLKTATDLQVVGVMLAGFWVFAGLASVHIVRNNLCRRASKLEQTEKIDDPA